MSADESSMKGTAVASFAALHRMVKFKSFIAIREVGLSNTRLQEYARGGFDDDA